MDAADAAALPPPAAATHDERAPRVPSAWTAATLGWLVPGLGQAYAGRPLRGLYFAGVVLATFVGGLALADFRGVSWDRERIWFVADALAAGPTALVAWLTDGLDVARRAPAYDVGLLYTAVAGLLNVVVMGDALGLVDDAQRARRAYERERWLAAEERPRAEREAAAAADPDREAAAYETSVAAETDALPPEALDAPASAADLGSAGADAPGPDATAP